MDSGGEVVRPMTMNGTDLADSLRGDGEPLLLVHAGVFSDWFAPLSARRVLDDFRVIRICRAG